MAAAVFFEKQSVPTWWRITIFGLVTLGMGFVFLMTYLTEWETLSESDRMMMLLLLIGPLSTALLFVIRLEIKISQEAIEYRMLPLGGRPRKILFSQIAEMELKSGNMLRASSMIGVNKRIRRRDYNFGSRHLLIIRMKNGSHYSFSTFKPKELRYFIDHLPEEVPVKDRTN